MKIFNLLVTCVLAVSFVPSQTFATTATMPSQTISEGIFSEEAGVKGSQTKKYNKNDNGSKGDKHNPHNKHSSKHGKSDKRSKSDKPSKSDKSKKDKQGKGYKGSKKDLKSKTKGKSKHERFREAEEKQETQEAARGPAGKDFASSFALVHHAEFNQIVNSGDVIAFSQASLVSGGGDIAYEAPTFKFTTPGRYLIEFYVPFYTIVNTLPFTVRNIQGVAPAPVSFVLHGVNSAEPVNFLGVYGSLEDAEGGHFKLHGSVRGAYIIDVTGYDQEITLNFQPGGPEQLVVNPSRDGFDSNNTAYFYVLRQD